MKKNRERNCVDCSADLGRDFPALNVAPFCIPRGQTYWDGERMLWPWELARGEVRPVCDMHRELNDKFWIAFTGRDANGNRSEQSETGSEP